MAIVKYIGFAPDADPVTPGVITDCAMLEPSIRGMKGAPSASSTDYTALAGECKGSALVKKLDGTSRLFAATQTKLYEGSSGSWTDRSGSTYVGSADARWTFAQWGDVTIAQNGVDAAQTSSSTTFSTLTAMPPANLMCTVAGFVMLANVTHVSYAFSDAWWCSALYDYTNWTPSIATQCAQGRLYDDPGAIRALHPLGENVAAFKERSIYLGQYVGPDVIWAWTRVPGDVGAYSQGSVISDGQVLYFWGGDDFYRFDGTRPQPIGSALKEWFLENADRAYWSKIQGAYDKRTSLARWYYVPNGSTTLTACVVLNTRTGQWGRADRAIESTVAYVASAITYDSPGILTGVTYDSTSFLQSYDSPFWLASSESPAIFNASHQLRTLTGVSDSSSLTTGDFGDDDRYSLLRRVRPRYADAPDSASMTAYYKQDAGDAVTTGETVDANDGKFDVLQSARWHRVKFEFTGDVETTGYTADLVPEGER